MNHQHSNIDFNLVTKITNKIIQGDYSVVETHKNLLISSQNIIYDALNNEDLDIFKKANLALRYLSLIKGKEDITQKSSHNLFKHAELGNFKRFY